MVRNNTLDFHFYPGMAGSFLKLTATNRFPLFSENMYEIWRIPVVKKEAERVGYMQASICENAAVRIRFYCRVPVHSFHAPLPCELNKVLQLPTQSSNVLLLNTHIVRPLWGAGGRGGGQANLFYDGSRQKKRNTALSLTHLPPTHLFSPQPSSCRKELYV
jgi:hypothetical protein